jgi:hypothetical protein
MRERHTAAGFKVAGIATGKSNGAKSSRKEPIKSVNTKQAVQKPKKRAAPAKEESDDDDLEDFGNVEIDINSDDEEEVQDDDIEESDDEVEEFPEDQSEGEEANQGDDDEEEDEDEDEEEGEGEGEGEGEEEEEEEEDDDYMAGDSLDEEEWNEDAKIRYSNSVQQKRRYLLYTDIVIFAAKTMIASDQPSCPKSKPTMIVIHPPKM